MLINPKIKSRLTNLDGGLKFNPILKQKFITFVKFIR